MFISLATGHWTARLLELRGQVFLSCEAISAFGTGLFSELSGNYEMIGFGNNFVSKHQTLNAKSDMILVN